MLKEDFGTEQVKKLIDNEHIDFMVFFEGYEGDPKPSIALVEAKCTRHGSYYFMDTPEKKRQWQAYFDFKRNLESAGFTASIWLYLKKPEGIKKALLESAERIPICL
jgi:hypothetical protein